MGGGFIALQSRARGLRAGAGLLPRGSERRSAAKAGFYIASLLSAARSPPVLYHQQISLHDGRNMRALMRERVELQSPLRSQHVTGVRHMSRHGDRKRPGCDDSSRELDQNHFAW